ncbi:hypothetical protein L1049_018804 [Liquidambar formosana]|uniref:Pentatricopeptide repeat-containing protein n=1 Tax=Liquidambar formosana TaxID=63359 RepID=A0AAP0RAL1_LIQFO
MEIPACVAFQRLPLLPNKTQTKDPKHWNSIIKHHTKLKNDTGILTTYTHMESLGICPDNSTLPLVLKACARLNAVESGKKIHSHIQNTKLIEDVRVRTALVDFYCKCGFFEEALHVFGEMSERDVVLWNAMISGYVGRGHHEEAIGLFMKMGRENLRPSSGTMVALLLACGELLELRMGKEVHGYCLRNGLFEADPRVITALIGFYLRFDVRVSRLVFDMMDSRSIVSWNAMIRGYFDVGDCSEALKLFMQMLVDGVTFDSVTMLVAIQVCAEFGSLKLGMQIHQMAIKLEFNNDLFVANALLRMYSENGSLEFSRELFESITTRDIAMWNSMISVYIGFGCYEEALSLFIRIRTECIREDEITIAIMLSVCEQLADGLRMGKAYMPM